MDSHRLVGRVFNTEAPVDPLPVDEDKLMNQRFVSIAIEFGDTYRADL